ncbi:MAG: efflux RND transporter periplasmic adaptor subunit [Polyangiaceae bacterium]|nr:efflux RND transporter periplasmic adaptor subunit [Polyangiaceae bacterium]
MSEQPGPALVSTPSSRGRRWVFAALGSLVVALLIGAARYRAEGQGKSGSPADERVVSVVVTNAERRSVPISLDGLGTVVARSTVTVKPQVDGRLDRVVFREGQSVKQGDVLAEIDPRPFNAALAAAEATLEKDRATLAGAQINLRRFTELAKSGIATGQSVDDQRALVEQLRATVQGDRAQIDRAKLDVEYARVVSPIDGVTGIRLVDAGNIIHTTDPGLVVVTQLDPIDVVFSLPMDDLVEVSDALKKEALPVDARDRTGNRTIATGKLDLIDNQINTATGTIRLKASFSNPDKHLWPNQFVKASVVVRTEEDALVVPAVAIQRGPTGSFVYVVEDGDVAAARPVEVERIQGEIALLRSGITEGERVVLDGQAQLKPGSKVQPRARTET